MKVENKMIAKDLRFMGKVYRLTNRLLFVKRKRKSKKVGMIKYIMVGNLKKRKYNQNLTRKDQSLMRLMIWKAKEKEEKVPGLLWLHGGGYELGVPEMAMLSMANQIDHLGKCTIVSPDYTLSVDQPYPAALEDCYQALLWMKEHADELGINENQLFVGGESAGGGLAAAICLYARDKGEVKIAFQMPLYPMIDDRLTSESMKDNNAPVWSEKQNRAAWENYLKGQDKDNISKYAAPARETDYTNLPPAATFVGSIDPFCDETIEYMRKLQESQIRADYMVFEGCYHAFDIVVPWSKEAKRARRFMLERFEYACENYYNA